MSNKVYDILKWLVIVVMPAISTLVIGLGNLYGFDSTLIAGTITLLTTFVGTIIGISSVKYNKEN